MDSRDPRLREIWRRADPPVVFRRGAGSPLLVRLPYARTNYEWLRDEKRHKPKWDSKFKCWEIPVSWYEWIAKRLVNRYSSAYLVQVYKEQQKCFIKEVAL